LGKQRATAKGVATMRKLPKVADLTPQERQIYKLLRLFIRYSYTGLLVFFGQADFPDAETLYEMKLAEYIASYKKRHNGKTPENVATKRSSGTAYAQIVVEVADTIHEQIRNVGGLATFRAAFEELSHTQSRNMNILRDLSRRAGTLETIADIAEKNWLSDPQITNIKNRMLITLAINISSRANAAISARPEIEKDIA